jgi:hypothetical protein
MEQIRGIGTSPRSDLYSLSATLYQLMTNVVPPDALTRADVMLNGLPDPITPINELNPEIPPAVSAVVLRGMEVSQDKRYDTAREMQKTLRKAFAEMQQAMSAKTVAISNSEVAAGLSQASSFEATEVMDPEALRAISNPAGDSKSGFSENISQPTSPHTNMDATVAFDPSEVSGGLKQSDVKTEVFTAGNSFPVPPENPQPYASDPTPPPAAPQENFALTTDYSNLGSPGAETFVPSGELYSAEATAANIAFQANGTAAWENAPPMGGFDQAEAPRADHDSQPQRQQASVAAVPAKKGSTGKIVALLGGLFIFFVVVLAAAGGGYYYFANYMGIAVDPTPLPTVEPSPSPTLESVVPDSSNVAMPSPTPMGTPEPTATPSEIVPDQPQTDRPDTRPTPVGTKPTPRPRPSATVKPAPTKKPGGGAPDILQ